ncbi:MAG: ATP synthase F1 subunit epsilon [Bdellovibrionia bacterium]
MLKLNLVTPIKKLVTDLEIDEVFVPAYRGELNILPGHAALVTTLSTGVLKYRAKGESSLHHVAISWGYCEVFNEEVTVLAETAEDAGEIDVDRAQDALRRANQALSGKDGLPEDIEKFQNKIDRSITRIEVAKSKS